MEEAKPRSPRASGAAPTQPRGIEQIIKAAVDRGASDLHIKAGDVFRARIDGKLVPLTKQRLTPEQTRAIALRLMPNEDDRRSEEHTSELQSPCNLVCRLLLEKKKNHTRINTASALLM